ncbi:helix-turn-helix domain-containing protein [Vibrio campbellii]
MASVESNSSIKSQSFKNLEINSAWFEMLDDFIARHNIPKEQIFPNLQQYQQWKQSPVVDYSELKQCLKRIVDYNDDYTTLFLAVDGITPMSFGTVGVMLASATDLRSLLKLMSEFQALFGGSHRTVYRETPHGEGELWLIDRAIRDNDLHKELIILYGAALLKFIRLCCGDSSLTVHFKMLDWYIGEENLRKFKQVTGCEMDYGHSMRRIAIKKKDLTKPLKFANSSLHEATKKAAYDELKLSVESNVIALTHKAFYDIGLNKSTQESVAQYLNMSSRSYSRKLKQLDTSFSEVLKQYRLEFVLKEFDSNKDNLTEIAYQLGFSELSAFSHAFKRWTGLSPREALNQHTPRS